MTSPPPITQHDTAEPSKFGAECRDESLQRHDVETAEPSISVRSESPGLGDNSNVPRLSLLKLFWFFFYNFGLFAWGGPVAQIALIKDKLVVQDKWITLARFQRVFAVYQVLPGPEAAELCMFFGCLSAGRIGGILAGIAFILPGFALMLLASYLYTLAGFENIYFNASFRALQPVVAAMVLRATHKIAEHSVRKHDTAKVDPFLVLFAICTAINGALRINIFISLGLYGIIYAFIARRLWIPAGVLFILQYVGYALYVVFHGVPLPVSLALGIAKTPSLINLFVLGLVAGSLSFGGAYTAIPFVQVEAVLMGGWLPQSVFIDGIAIGNILPAPLVIFATFVGFQGAYGQDGSLGNAFAGAVIITLGMFFPCFVFTIAGHEVLEKLVHNKFLSSFFDGLCGSVIGVIAIIAVQILKAGVEGPVDKLRSKPLDEVISGVVQVGPAAVLFMLALGALYKFTNKYTALVMVVIAAVAGQFLFVD
ncbi:chromate transporter-domain-containing protein [Microdochium trichocladiopsis]|uniref:Chromate transporter-domain-containing protein n=1 Tax=Microdochium trichocladiopsis TaxID=1682393 RepID=A0A9P9BJC6_9PEZI|nr:chromate transporter-domain-containing protein [Microdochium trichocladiopsis]KAH7025088.1 chromate transporter-domain-containing protein [Microdochium trichocladiopsis]